MKKKFIQLSWSEDARRHENPDKTTLCEVWDF